MKQSILTGLALMLAQLCSAQNMPPPPPDSPIDGAWFILLAGGVLLVLTRNLKLKSDEKKKHI